MNRSKLFAQNLLSLNNKRAFKFDPRVLVEDKFVRLAADPDTQKPEHGRNERDKNKQTEGELCRRLLKDSRRGASLRTTNLTLQWLSIKNRHFSTNVASIEPEIRVQFANGLFKLFFYGKFQTVLGFWQTTGEIASVLSKDVFPETLGNTNSKVYQFRAVSSEDNTSFDLSPSMPVGYLFASLNPKNISLETTLKNAEAGGDKRKLVFHFDIDPNTIAAIREWSEVCVRQSQFSSQQPQFSASSNKTTFAEHELSFLEQERDQLQTQFEPMKVQFDRLVQQARLDAQRKFKFGGLFFLAAQLGFVGRLTYFEYSWDIMEPLTWMLTYSTYCATFAYYIVTSEEYLIPTVERRMLVDKFWKLANSKQFDADTYRQLRDRIVRIDKKIHKIHRNKMTQ